jgi:2-polyprenyl-3-methyl-5-hydroxy-6-metoxy-1,4-benzoquinol methylase
LLSFLEQAYPRHSYLREILKYSPDLACHFDIVKLARSSLRDGARVLDLGAGGLDKVLPLAAMGYECSAFDDFGDPWHQTCRDQIIDLASEYNINLVTGSLRNLQLDWCLGRGFDMIMLNDVIEHLPFSPLSLIRECFEHLEPRRDSRD